MSKSYHERIVAKTKEFIRRVHSDQSVSPKQTLDSLELLRDVVEICIMGVREDIEREAKDD